MITEDTIHGFFAFVFLAAVPVAALLGVIIRKRYRKAITRAMMQASDVPETAFAVPAPSTPNAAHVVFDTQPLDARGPLRLGLATRYFLAGLAFALVTTLVLLTLSDFGFNPMRFGVLTATFSFPAVVMALYVSGARLPWILVAAGLWLGGLALVAPMGLAVLGLLVGPALLLAFVVGNPNLRTTAVPLFFVALALIAPLMLSLDVTLAVLTSGVFDALWDVFPAAAVSTLHYVIGFAVTLTIGGAMALAAVQLVARLTAQSSEFMMQHDLLWLFQCLWLINLGGQDFGLAVLFYFASFVAYRLVLWLLRPKGTAQEINLLLRVFGQADSQRALARSLLLQWRVEGPVLLIGADDLATETLDAPELAAYLRRRLKRIFVETPEDLERLRGAGESRLGDGLFPMQDYYCRDNSWRPTILTLMSRARRVLIDMRGFDPANQGIQFEIDALAARVPSDRITIVATPDQLEAIHARFAQAWAAAAVNTDPGGAPDHISVRLAPTSG